MQHEVEISRQVQAPPAAVWEVITDLSRAQERLSQVTALQVLTPGPYALGTRWRETRRMMGSSETQELVVVENDPLRSTVVEALDGSTRYRTVLTLEPQDASGSSAVEADEATCTLLGIRFGADVTDPGRLQRLALKVIGPLGTKLTEKSLRTELEDMAAAAEQLARGHA